MQVTSMNLIECHRELHKLIYAYDYYVSIYEQIVEKYPVDMADPESIHSFWNNFWYALPDTRAIQRDPFNFICDMAEGSYLQS